MLFARDSVGVSRPPHATGDRGTCDFCRSEVIAKCGTYTVHHWAHKDTGLCDSWESSESDWHRGWKAEIETVTQRFTEVTLERGGVRHRADIQLCDKRVVELQHTTLSPEDVVARETFYQRGLWLYHGESIKFTRGRVHQGRFGFWWKNGAKRLLGHRWPLWIDTGDEVVCVGLNGVRGGSRIVGKRMGSVTRSGFAAYLQGHTVRPDLLFHPDALRVDGIMEAQQKDRLRRDFDNRLPGVRPQ